MTVKTRTGLSLFAVAIGIAAFLLMFRFAGKYEHSHPSGKGIARPAPTQEPSSVQVGGGQDYLQPDPMVPIPALHDPSPIGAVQPRPARLWANGQDTGRGEIEAPVIGMPGDPLKEIWPGY